MIRKCLKKDGGEKENDNCKKIVKCFECDSASFHVEYKLNEISCLKCGLVLIAPPSPDFVTDGYRVIIEKKKVSKEKKS